MRSTVRRLAAGTAIAALSTLAVTGFAGAASAAAVPDDGSASSSGSISGASSHDEGAAGGFDYDATTVYVHHVHVKGWGATGSSDRHSGQANFASEFMGDD